MHSELTHPVGPAVLALWRRARVGCAALALLGSAASAQAALVGYDWVPGPGSGGTGKMIFDLGSGTNGTAFSVPAASLTSFTFTFANGNVITLATLNSISVTTGLWTAASGYLTTTAQLSDTIAPLIATFQLVPYSLASPNPNGSTAVQTSPSVEQNFGVWKLSTTPVAAVPLPAAAWMLGAGLVAFAGMRRRRAEA